MIRQLTQISVKTKILLFALILIILPSGILGYFGFKSIENHGLGLEENYRGMVRLIRDKLENEFFDLESGFLQDVSNKSWSQESQTIMNLLKQLQEQFSLIGELFIMDANGQIFHPKMTLFADVLSRSEPLGLQTEGNKLISLGERYEYIEEDYPTALRHYNQSMNQ